MNFIIIIPARYSSKRLLVKPLIDINGKPMIIHVLDRARESNADRIIVATDHQEIASVVKNADGEVCMTSNNHQSGTERLAEVVEKYNFSDETLIINIQSDEPTISAKIIHQVVENLILQQVTMTTVSAPIYDIDQAFNKNIVKVVTDIKGYALYFSRSIIPWNKNIFSTKVKKNNKIIAWRHLGIYGYRANFLRRYVNWDPSPLESIEMLEQLRVLWYGEKIYVSIAADKSGTGVNTPEDLTMVRVELN